ncbi:MAG: hypothetical protein DRP22_01330, partial [Verrucomicrobia bacterium]
CSLHHSCCARFRRGEEFPHAILPMFGTFQVKASKAAPIPVGAGLEFSIPRVAGLCARKAGLEGSEEKGAERSWAAEAG